MEPVTGNEYVLRKERVVVYAISPMGELVYYRPVNGNRQYAMGRLVWDQYARRGELRHVGKS